MQLGGFNATRNTMPFEYHARGNGDVAREFGIYAEGVGMQVGRETKARGSIAGTWKPHTHFTRFNLNTIGDQFQQDDDRIVNLNDNHYS
jgi:hypothetical protein